MKEFLNPENKQFKDLDDDQMLAVIKAKIANRLLLCVRLQSRRLKDGEIE